MGKVKMRQALVIALLNVAACRPGEQEIHTTSVDVDDVRAPAPVAARGAVSSLARERLSAL